MISREEKSVINTVLISKNFSIITFACLLLFTKTYYSIIAKIEQKDKQKQGKIDKFVKIVKRRRKRNPP
jgi:hypothetical protein